MLRSTCATSPLIFTPATSMAVALVVVNVGLYVCCCCFFIALSAKQRGQYVNKSSRVHRVESREVQQWKDSSRGTVRFVVRVAGCAPCRISKPDQGTYKISFYPTMVAVSMVLLRAMDWVLLLVRYCAVGLCQVRALQPKLLQATSLRALVAYGFTHLCKNPVVFTEPGLSRKTEPWMVKRCSSRALLMPPCMSHCCLWAWSLSLRGRKDDASYWSAKNKRGGIDANVIMRTIMSCLRTTGNSSEDTPEWAAWLMSSPG